MNWIIIGEIVYIFVIIAVCLRIIYDTQSNTKTLAYVLVVIFLPFIGIFIYFSFGINYRKRTLYSKKLIVDKEAADDLKNRLNTYSKTTYEQHQHALRGNKKLSHLVIRENDSPLTSGNDVRLLENGERKFPELLEAIKSAKEHIHVEYYIYKNDKIGNILADALIEKAKEGVEVRLIYDHFGSSSIHRSLANRLRENGVQAFPFHKITFVALANRLNYRNHRKIVVIDGRIAFVGGINIADSYHNELGVGNEWFWRDTHLRIAGPGVYYLQYIFLCDWNFSADKKLGPDEKFFPNHQGFEKIGDKVVQIVSSGPDCAHPTILYSLLEAIYSAREEILITSPYYIPGESLQHALIVTSLSGVKIKLLVPGLSDSKFVNAAAHSYYDDLLAAGVEIYCYQKGFVHAKTMVTDRKLAVVGTANMDQRSFDLNFEVNALVYDENIAGQLANSFEEDLKHADRLSQEEREAKPTYIKLLEKIARLVSPML